MLPLNPLQPCISVYLYIGETAIFISLVEYFLNERALYFSIYKFD